MGEVGSWGSRKCLVTDNSLPAIWGVSFAFCALHLDNPGINGFDGEKNFRTTVGSLLNYKSTEGKNKTYSSFIGASYGKSQLIVLALAFMPSSLPLSYI